ncbi:MAG: baseplate J/gp47 family protein, partial [Lewinella sp.]|nr:baseplate J/gp47 family protein [Lewinella sp.]
ELTTEDGRWHPFGNRTVDGTDNTWQIDLPRAEIGFALASNYLYLTQGERVAELKFAGSGLAALSGKTFKLFLTTEEGWYETTVTVDQSPVDNRYRLQWTIDGDQPAIVPYDAAVHGGTFATPYPLLKAQLVQTDSPDYAYQALKNITLQSFDLTVVVTGKRNMALSSSTGPLDASKPFHPFGAAPEDGAVFTLGDKEIFQKSATISLNISWKAELDYSDFYHAHSSGRHPKTKYRELRKGAWALDNDLNILPGAGEAVETPIILGTDALIAPDFSDNSPFTSADTAGFLRFRLYGDWGHSNYPRSLAYYAKQGGSLPKLLYDPQILDFSVNYTASQHISLNNAAAYASEHARFFHLHPFGEAERAPGSGTVRLLPELVPQSVISTPEGPVNNVGKDGGEWYIGVEDLAPPQELSLFIQLAPGTADPLLAKPEAHVKWWYLSQNNWVPFENNDLADGTRQLLQSGLIRFSVPRGANTDNTLMPAGKTWLRATVETAVDAVNQIVGVHAQGTIATQVMESTDPALGAVALPAGTITKLRQPIGNIKKFEQPYATFGSSAREEAEAFYTRISERLRHKQRAITQWDYERILLQAFPQIHKIKCLNHLRFEPATPTPIYRELAPGHVTIIGVSDVRNQNGVDPLRPYLSLADLESMEDTLRGLTSCFVRLHLRNPIFEPVLASFKVRLFPGYDETFYEQLLNEEIIRFMSPWAFP